MIENTFTPKLTPNLLRYISWEINEIQNNLKKGRYDKNCEGKKNTDPTGEAFHRIYKMLEEISLYGTHDMPDAPFYGWVKANIEIELFRQFKEFYSIVD
jgi:hypothetical protein